MEVEGLKETSPLLMSPPPLELGMSRALSSLRASPGKLDKDQGSQGFPEPSLLDPRTSVTALLPPSISPTPFHRVLTTAGKKL